MTLQETLEKLQAKNITGLFSETIETETENENGELEYGEGILLHGETEHIIIEMMDGVYWVTANAPALPVMDYEQLENLLLKVWERIEL